MLSRLLAVSAATLMSLPCSHAGITLHAADLGGSVWTLSLDKNPDGGPDLAITNTSSSVFESIRYLSMDRDAVPRRLFVADVGNDQGNGTMYILRNDTLAILGNASTPTDPTYSLSFGTNNGADGYSGLAVPSYGGSAFSTYDVSDLTAPTQVQAEFYTLTASGPESAQTASHPHQAILDPSGQYLVIPDLGADLLRIIHLDGLAFEEIDTITLPPGTGPRHGVFTTSATIPSAANQTYFYLIGELSNSLTGYQISYSNSTAPPTFTQVYNSTTHGLGNDPVPGAASGDIHISPDGAYILVSSRYDNTSQNATNPTGQGPINSFSIDYTSGNLSLVQQFAIGGSVAAEFAIDLSGTLVAYGYQDQSLLTVVHRDLATGLLLEVAGTFNLTGRMTGVVFDDFPLA